MVWANSLRLEVGGDLAQKYLKGEYHRPRKLPGRRTRNTMWHPGEKWGCVRT